MRVAAEDGEKAISVLADGGFKVLTEYVQDLTPYLPNP
jgi:acetoin utilization protein AcuB